MRPALRGWIYASAAYLSWGFFPIYFKAVSRAQPLEILAHRIVWSTLLLFGFAAITGALPKLRVPSALGIKLPTLVLTTALISTNWLTYIWAVQHGRVMEGSLGYFLTPLVNVLLGVWLLNEKLRFVQRISVGLAMLGVALLVLPEGRLPWVAVVLASSFGLYGLTRKRAGVDPVLGLLAETALLAPPALGYLVWLGVHGAGQWGQGDGRLTTLLTLAGLLTSLPLVWFAEGVRRLPLSAVGLLQYLSPTVQLLLAVILYGEPFTQTHGLAFAAIWASLALYSTEAVWRARRPLPTSPSR